MNHPTIPMGRRRFPGLSAAGAAAALAACSAPVSVPPVNRVMPMTQWWPPTKRGACGPEQR